MRKTNPKRIIIIALSTVAIGCIFIAPLFSPAGIPSYDWAEGRAIAGAMARIFAEYSCINRQNGHYPPRWKDLESFVGGVFIPEDEGNFRKKHIRWEVHYAPDLDPPVEFKIIVIRPPNFDKPNALMLNNKGEWFYLDDNSNWIEDSFRSSNIADIACCESIERMYYITGKLSQEPKK